MAESLYRPGERDESGLVPDAVLCVLCRRRNPNPSCSACPACVPPDEGEIRLQGTVAALEAELEMTADKLSDCWLWLDAVARLHPESNSLDLIRQGAARLLRRQQAPGWKDAPK